MRGLSRLRPWIAAMLFAMALPCVAQQTVLGQRIPADARHGVMSFVSEMTVAIDNQTVRLAPGALIRDAGNFVILPTMLPAGSKAAYSLNDQGEVFRVWVLTPDEIARFTWEDDE